MTDLQCPHCAGTGWNDHLDRHTNTATDVCRPCAGTGMIKADTGMRREASFNPTTGRCFGNGFAPYRASDVRGGGR